MGGRTLQRGKKRGEDFVQEYTGEAQERPRPSSGKGLGTPNLGLCRPAPHSQGGTDTLLQAASTAQWDWV